MPKLKNPRQERFAREVALGKSQSEAYRIAYGAVGWPGQNACNLMRNIDVWERVEELQAEHAENVALTAHEMHSFLRDVVKTPVGQIDEHSPLCESVEDTKYGRKVKTPSKLKALELAAQLQGMLGAGGAAEARPHVRLQLIASGGASVAAQLDMM
jgi:hypothetical protein